MIIDKQALDALYSIQPENEPDFVSNILDIFLTSTEENIGILDSAHDTGDLDSLTRAAHTIKSSSANVGANALMAISKELENDCRSNNLALADCQIALIKVEFQKVKTYLNEQLLC